MLDELIGGVLVQLLARITRFVLFPVALVICTPFILIHAAVLALRRQGQFGHVVADDYSTLDVYWWS